MKRSHLDQICEALFYEGYLLYPYRPSAAKNKQRFTFGRVYPRGFSEAQKGAEPCSMQTECIAQIAGRPGSVEISLKFLHVMAREIHALSAPPRELAGREGYTFSIVPELHLNAKLFQTWQEALERKVMPPPLRLEEGQSSRESFRFCFSAGHTFEPIREREEAPVGAINRRQESLQGVVEAIAEPVGEKLFRIAVRVVNETPVYEAHFKEPEAVLMRTFASTHFVLQARNCQFSSMTDPPAECRGAVAGCCNLGVWPVLVGDEQQAERITMLSSPIILPDYPKIAAESKGPMFDGTEIDEMLSLRIMTLAEREKGEMRQADEHARRLLERTEALERGDWMKMHGTMRPGRSFDEQIFGSAQRLDSVAVNGTTLRAGDKVRIRPKSRADAMDMALNGKTAVIETVEQDADGGVHLALVLDDDPGKDLGMLRQPGHRFFYGLDEVEPWREGA